MIQIAKYNLLWFRVQSSHSHHIQLPAERGRLFGAEQLEVLLPLILRELIILYPFWNWVLPYGKRELMTITGKKL
jgi:hypothetical protein